MGKKVFFGVSTAPYTYIVHVPVHDIIYMYMIHHAKRHVDRSHINATRMVTHLIGFTISSGSVITTSLTKKVVFASFVQKKYHHAMSLFTKFRKVS